MDPLQGCRAAAGADDGEPLGQVRQPAVQSWRVAILGRLAGWPGRSERSPFHVPMSTRANLDEAERAAVEAAERLGVPLEVISCEPEFADTAAFCAHYHYPVERAANTLIVASKKEPRQYAACVVLATTRLDVNHAVRDLLGSAKCSFASAEEMRAVTGMTVGGVTAFGLPEGLPLYVDSRVMDLDWIILGTGGRNGKIRIAPEVFRRMPPAKVVEGLAMVLRS
jgi:prolyl-tRNA editing enzyme YbaK/EbsC (Cys-tRNA(Pro) deacylase)